MIQIDPLGLEQCRNFGKSTGVVVDRVLGRVVAESCTRDDERGIWDQAEIVYASLDRQLVLAMFLRVPDLIHDLPEPDFH